MQLVSNMGKPRTRISLGNILLFCLSLNISAVTGRRTAQLGNPRRRPYRTRVQPQFVDLCETSRGTEGECHPKTECWATDVGNTELEPCEWNGYPEQYFCCPDYAENIKPSPPNRWQPASFTTARPFKNPFYMNPTRGYQPFPFMTSTRLPIVSTKRPGNKPAWTTSTKRRILPTRPSTARRTTISFRPTSTRPPVVPNFQHGCGQRYPDKLGDRGIGAFVLGGTNAEENSWPWMVSIHMSRNRGPSRFLCGGSLITSTHILTAAHCFDMKENSVRFTVRIGSNTVSSTTVSTSQEGHLNVVKIRIHEQYVPKVYNHDIAVLTFSRDLEFMENVSPVCLPSAQDLRLVTERANVTLTGWGHTSYGGKFSPNLQEAAFQIIPLNLCQTSYGKLESQSLPQGITTRMLCAGIPEGGVDACQGDSGGPLVLDTGTRWIQVGVVSFGFRCGVKDYPGVYTRITSYTDWIHRVLREKMD